MRRSIRKSTQTVEAVVAATAQECGVKPDNVVGFRGERLAETLWITLVVDTRLRRWRSWPMRSVSHNEKVWAVRSSVPGVLTKRTEKLTAASARSKNDDA